MAERVLIVDGDFPSGLLLVSVLKELGVEPRVIDRATTDPVEFFFEFQPDLVILDMRVSAPAALEILRNLRTPRAFAGYLPLLVLTSDDTRASRETALLLGADEFLHEPIDRVEAVVRVRNLLLTRRLYQDLAGLAEDDLIES